MGFRLFAQTCIWLLFLWSREFLDKSRIVCKQDILEILPASDALTKNYENWKIFI